MWNEHFGISVVEGLAAGNIMVAHNSGKSYSPEMLAISFCRKISAINFYVLVLQIIFLGGPKLDIIRNDEQCGFLATTPEGFLGLFLLKYFIRICGRHYENH